jgi:spermidine synthase
MLARIAMEQLPEKSHVVNIGLGCGFTASEMAFHQKAGTLDVVEINPIIPKAAAFFEAENKNVLNAPNTALHIMDGAAWLRTAPDKKADAIIIDVEEVSVIYSSVLYTREYFGIIKQKMKDGGVFGLWSFRVNPSFTRIMLNTLRSEFPYVYVLYYNDSATYYASTRPLNITPNSSAFAEQVNALPLHEINTLENRALEKYYKSNQVFGLPEDYKERFVR